MNITEIETNGIAFINDALLQTHIIGEAWIITLIITIILTLIITRNTNKMGTTSLLIYIGLWIAGLPIHALTIFIISIWAVINLLGTDTIEMITSNITQTAIQKITRSNIKKQANKIYSKEQKKQLLGLSLENLERVVKTGRIPTEQQTQKPQKKQWYNRIKMPIQDTKTYNPTTPGDLKKRAKNRMYEFNRRKKQKHKKPGFLYENFDEQSTLNIKPKNNE